MTENKINDDIEKTNNVKDENEVKSAKEEKIDKKADKKNLHEQLEKARNEAKEWQDKYYRAYADLDNQRKQYQNEYRMNLKYQAQSVIEKLIPAVDIFAMVLASKDKVSTEVANYISGFEMIYSQIISAFESEGLKEIIIKVGDNYDSKTAYAMDTVEVEDASEVNKIVTIYSKGYMLHERLIRPASVVVSVLKKVSQDNKEKGEMKNG